MDSLLEGKDISLWMDTTPKTDYPKLGSDDATYDLVVVGGGITGVMAAYYAGQRGLKTALVEKRRLVEWTTGGTTAKLSSQHYLIYDYLIESQGEATARSFASANQRGIDEIESVSRRLDIDCDFSRRNSYVYTSRDDKVEAITREVDAAKKLGLPASSATDIELPYDVKGAVRFENQAQFHPRKFLLKIAEEFVKNGGVIYEKTEATDIVPGEPITVKTDAGNLRTNHLLQASGKPFWNGDIFKDFMWEKVSYALAVKLKDNSAYPKGMYITTDDPMRTVRSAEHEDGQVLIFGGESQEYSDDTFDPEKHHKILAEEVYEKYDVDTILYRWLASDFMPYDRMPYIGPMPEHPSIYVATGYRAWGLAWAVSAAEAIVDEIAGKPAAWVKPFSLDRMQRTLGEDVKVHGV